MSSHDRAAAAALHVPGRGSPDLQLLRTGLTHDTYRVTRDARSFSLRVPSALAIDLGQDLAWEARVLELAAAAGLAPTPRYVDPAAAVLVLDWVGGRSWSEAETRTPTQLSRMAWTLRRLHALHVPQPARAVTPGRWIEYYSCAGAGADRVLERAAQTRLAAPEHGGARGAVLCHSDLHRLNVVDGDMSIALLDFEYAHVSDPLWDLAAWSANNDFGEEHRRSLLAAYLGRGATFSEIGELVRLEWLYDYVCLLWSRLYVSRAGADGAMDILARARVIEARLLGTLD